MTAGFQDYISALSEHEMAICQTRLSPKELIMMCSGARLNSLGQLISDSAIHWSLSQVKIDDLKLIRGISPELGELIATQCRGSASLLRALILENSSARMAFSKETTFDDAPIIAIQHRGSPKVFDGIHRVVAAIIEGRTLIWAWIGMPHGTPSTECESHVVYDLLRSFTGGNRDRERLLAALIYLRKGYSNVSSLLEDEFSGKWGANTELQEVITEALGTEIEA